MMTARSHSSADNGTVLQAQVQLQKAAKALEAMAEKLAEAKQIKEYDGDRRKRVLAQAMKKFLDEGESAAAAECKGRASEIYGTCLFELQGQYQGAMEVIEKWESTRILWESARSILSVEKAKIQIL